MEEKTEAVVADQAVIEIARPPKSKKVAGNEASGGAKKKRGAMHLIRVAMFILRRHSGKSKAIEVGSRGTWKQVVGSMRPLHLQGNHSPPAPIEEDTPPAPTLSMNEHYEDVLPMPFSPGASSSSSHSVDSMSRYASAVNLQELDRNESSDNEPDQNGGDDTIDMKAEMFIAQFYNNIKLQRLDSIHRYHQRIQRSME